MVQLETILVEQKFFTAFETSDPIDWTGEFTRNLTGSVMEKVGVEMTIDVAKGVEKSGTTVDNRGFDFENDGSSETFITIPKYDWRENGWEVGQLVAVQITTLTTTFNIGNIDVLAVVGDTITLDLYSAAHVDVIGIIVLLHSDFTALIHSFGLIDNSANFSSSSLLTSSDMGYYAGDIGVREPVIRNTNFKDMTPLGITNDWVAGTTQVRFVQTSGLLSSVQRFIIRHEFVLNPYYTDGTIDDLRDRVSPDYLLGDNTLKYAYNQDWRLVLNNPNTFVELRVENTLGSVAWFGESSNGFDSEYELFDLSYAVGADSADGIVIGATTRVTVNVRRKDLAMLPASQRVGSAFSFLPPQGAYTNTETTALENFLYDSKVLPSLGAAYIGAGIIKNLSASLTGGGISVEISIDIEFNFAQQVYLTQQYQDGYQNFLLGVLIGDIDLLAGNTNKVMLIADVGTFDLSEDIPDLGEMRFFQIYPHGSNPFVDAGFSDTIGWVEDGLRIIFQYVLNLDKKAFLNSMAYGIIAFNETTKEYFELDRFTLSLDNAVNVDGVLQIDEQQTRGYILKEDDPFNVVNYKLDSQDASEAIYSLVLSQKISWQEWIANSNVPTEFFDAMQKQNGLNNLASNYSEFKDYTIRFALFTNLSGENDDGRTGTTDYLHLSKPLKINFYDTDKDVDVDVISGVIQTFRASNNEDMLGSILSGEDTIMKVTWSSSAGAFASLDDVWAINRIELTDQQGYGITEMSSVREGTPSQLLKPLITETLLKLELVAGKIEATCLIKGSKIVAGTGYNLSGRIQVAVTTVIDSKITSPLDEPKDTSGTVELKTESPTI